jgi:glycosyltransferase involved in cell wall biosynthesis
VHKANLHICLLTSGRIFENSYGGEEKFTMSLGNWLLKRNIDVTIMGSTFAGVKSQRLTTSNSKINVQNNEKEQPKVKVIYPPYIIYFLSRLVLSLLWIIKIVFTHKKYNFTLIHAQDTGFSGLAAIIAGKISGIPIIISSHGIRHKSLESVVQGKFKKILLKAERSIDIFTVKHSKKVIVDNPSIKNYYEDIINKNIDFIPIPIKIENFEFSDLKRKCIRSELGINDAFKVVCFIGRFSPEKNIITLINSFNNVSKKDPSIVLMMVGGGIMESQIKDYVKDKEIEKKIIFCGIRLDIDKFFSGSDIFVLPSFIEGMSTALLEAMASGRAIICSDIPANRQLVSKDEAIFINPYKEDELELAILNLSKDEQLRKKLGQNAKKKVIQYDEDIVFSKFLEMYYLY